MRTSPACPSSASSRATAAAGISVRVPGDANCSACTSCDCFCVAVLTLADADHAPSVAWCRAPDATTALLSRPPCKNSHGARRRARSVPQSTYRTASSIAAVDPITTLRPNPGARLPETPPCPSRVVPTATTPPGSFSVSRRTQGARPPAATAPSMHRYFAPKGPPPPSLRLLRGPCPLRRAPRRPYLHSGPAYPRAISRVNSPPLLRSRHICPCAILRPPATHDFPVPARPPSAIAPVLLSPMLTC